ncbi:outer membrane lipoprotein carrier protein LolA [Marinomonas ostreistagni]|uniref:Outer membrane lipoprotein carrier protein LolA n=1 Tax=Marinomonas ostreistagni TaxID=359209 RepID=A0ABS0Z9J9_9GAMM|nr:outer membrane lipoprotein carrier protein LolA [Marinomonas ostreistagni]MBJ7550329.1 outer membrane lipoprotein carrier protein LolA [Marinomonas ostreistagni]
MKSAILFLIFFSHAIWAASVDELKELLHTPEQLSGHFDQEKYLAAVDTSLKSSGTFAYIAEQEISWHTLAPIENTLTLTPNQIITAQNGQQVSVLDSQNNPVVQVFSDLFFGVMTADWDLLQTYFHIEAHTSQEQWQAQLTPSDVNIAQAITHVSLSGGAFLEQVVLQEVNGNSTTIQFSELLAEGSQ